MNFEIQRFADVNTTIQLKTKQPNGKIVNRAYTYVNPDATDADLATAMQALANLSANTLIDIERVDKKALDSGTGAPVVKESPNLTLSEYEINGYAQSAGKGYELGVDTVTVTRAGDGEITATSNDTSVISVNVSGTTLNLSANGTGNTSIIVMVSETAAYYSDTATITVNINSSMNNPPPMP